MNHIKLNADGSISDIEGSERLSKEVAKHRDFIKLTARNATGNMSKDDLNQARMSL